MPRPWNVPGTRSTRMRGRRRTRDSRPWSMGACRARTSSAWPRRRGGARIRTRASTRSSARTPPSPPRAGREAAGVGLRLAMEYADRLDSAVWNGWLQRAARLLADEPECLEQGWLELCLVRSSFERGEIEEGERHAIAAQEIGTRLGERDLVAFGQALQGAILVMHTQLEQGLSLVDEATLAAVGGELTPYVAGNIYCITIGVCRSVADYRRASEWTEAAARWCEREAITGFPGICRVQRAEIMRLRGSYAEAEDEASKARTELETFGRLPQAGAGAYEVGEVRMRRGDLDGAEEAFEQSHRFGARAAAGDRVAPSRAGTGRCGPIVDRHGARGCGGPLRSSAPAAGAGRDRAGRLRRRRGARGGGGARRDRRVDRRADAAGGRAPGARRDADLRGGRRGRDRRAPQGRPHVDGGRGSVRGRPGAPLAGGRVPFGRRRGVRRPRAPVGQGRVRGPRGRS